MLKKQLDMRSYPFDTFSGSVQLPAGKYVPVIFNSMPDASGARDAAFANEAVFQLVPSAKLP